MNWIENGNANVRKWRMRARQGRRENNLAKDKVSRAGHQNVSICFSLSLDVSKLSLLSLALLHAAAHATSHLDLFELFRDLVNTALAVSVLSIGSGRTGRSNSVFLPSRGVGKAKRRSHVGRRRQQLR